MRVSVPLLNICLRSHFVSRTKIYSYTVLIHLYTVLPQLSETFTLYIVLLTLYIFFARSMAHSTPCCAHFLSASFTPSHFPAVQENIYVSDMSPQGCAYLDVAHLVSQSEGVFLTFLILACTLSACLPRKPTGNCFPPEIQRVVQSYSNMLRSFSSLLSKFILPLQFTLSRLRVKISLSTHPVH